MELPEQEIRNRARRIRGLIEFLETGVEKVREIKFDDVWIAFRAPDIWRSKYPVRSLLEENKTLRQEIQRLQDSEQNLRELLKENREDGAK